MMVQRTSIVVLGAEGCGKTSLVLRYVQGTFTEAYDPHIVDKYKKEDTIDGDVIVIDITDMCGSEDFADVRDRECIEAKSYIFVIDARAENQLEEVVRVRDDVVAGAGEKPSIVVVTKCDGDDGSQDSVLARAKETAAKWQVPFLECSAKLDLGVGEAFHQVVREVVTKSQAKKEQRGKPGQASVVRPSIDLDGSSSNASSSISSSSSSSSSDETKETESESE
ncbi:hypothetical protein DIPPA_50365, partial [Diplonema papillatum]